MNPNLNSLAQVLSNLGVDSALGHISSVLDGNSHNPHILIISNDPNNAITLANEIGYTIQSNQRYRTNHISNKIAKFENKSKSEITSKRTQTVNKSKSSKRVINARRLQRLSVSQLEQAKTKSRELTSLAEEVNQLLDTENLISVDYDKLRSKIENLILDIESKSDDIRTCCRMWTIVNCPNPDLETELAPKMVKTRQQKYTGTITNYITTLFSTVRNRSICVNDFDKLLNEEHEEYLDILLHLMKIRYCNVVVVAISYQELPQSLNSQFGLTIKI